MLPPEWLYIKRYILYSSLLSLVISASLYRQYNAECFYLDTRLRPAHLLTSDLKILYAIIYYNTVLYHIIIVNNGRGNIILPYCIGNIFLV
jgi:hypothetical protein